MYNQEKTEKLSRSEIGKMGAYALNSNADKKRNACLKAVQTCLERDPDHYKKMAIKRNQNK